MIKLGDESWIVQTRRREAEKVRLHSQQRQSSEKGRERQRSVLVRSGAGPRIWGEAARAGHACGREVSKSGSGRMAGWLVGGLRGLP